MLAKRIIPCLDVKDGTTVKGVQFINFRDAGDPVELGKQYSQMGADELVYIDITASHEGRRFPMSKGCWLLEPTRSRSTHLPCDVPSLSPRLPSVSDGRSASVP